MSTEVAWAAGFIEGEGSIGLMQVQRGRYRYMRIQASQVAREPLDRLQALFGGSINIRTRRGSLGTKPLHVWAVSGDAAHTAMDALRPYIGAVKRAQYDKAKVELEVAA